jgi:hypothetical protein
MQQHQLELSKYGGSKELISMLWGYFSPEERLFNGDAISELSHVAYTGYYECQWG